MDRVMAIDPGTDQSAWLMYGGEKPNRFSIDDNESVRIQLSRFEPGDFDVRFLAIEMVASYGMPVGREVFETCVWIGRFIEAWGGDWGFVYRKDVKIHLCGSMKAKDGNIRQALLDKFPRTGGGKTPQIGTKKEPGPLYGMKSHLWSALAVAITYCETER